MSVPALPVNAPRGIRRAALAATVALAALPAAAAEYSFEAEYRISISGLELGRAEIAGTFDGAAYRLDGRGKLTGLAGAIVEYRGSASAAGRIEPRGPVPSAFSVDATDGKKTTKVRMTLVGEDVRQIKLEPPLPKKEHPARVIVKDSHKRGVIDPMSALMAVGAARGGQVDRSVCDRTIPVFNGRERFDIELKYKASRTLDEPGYSGPAVVCEARYEPVAGHRTDRDEVKYFAARAAEVVYVPVANADLAIPFSVTVPTPIGNGQLTVVDLKSKGALRIRAASLGGR